METNQTLRRIASILSCLALFVPMCWANGPSSVAQIAPKKVPIKRSVSSTVPSGYSQLGESNLYYRNGGSSIDLFGKFGDTYYGCTYGDNGYRTAMKVNGNSAVDVNTTESGTESDSVKVVVTVEESGGLALFKYTVTNNSSNQDTISLGGYGDVMIGSNDAAPISKKNYLDGTTYGLVMSNSLETKDAQLVLLFGKDMDNVTAVDDYWFGSYGSNSSASNIVGDYVHGNNYMLENGSYDSALGWCWKNRVLKPKSTEVYSVLIGVGDVTLIPVVQSRKVTCADTTEWNDLSKPKEFDISGVYFSPASLKGVVYYSVDNSAWTALTDSLSSETAFSKKIQATFTPGLSTHSIRLMASDAAKEQSFSYSTKFSDVSSLIMDTIPAQTYDGKPKVINNLTVRDASGQTVLTEDSDYVLSYADNVSAGTGRINLGGRYPRTIGTSVHTFTISPANLSGTLNIGDSTYVYTGAEVKPLASYTGDVLAPLTLGTDYVFVYENNIQPGQATVAAVGKGNFTGRVSLNFEIQKAPMTKEDVGVSVPDNVYYSGTAYGATVTAKEGTGTYTVYYTDEQGNRTTNVPVEPGLYKVSIDFAEGQYYKAATFENGWSYSIYTLNAEELAVLKKFYTDADGANNWPESKRWSFPEDTKLAPTLPGITVYQGHVTGISLVDLTSSAPLPLALFALPKLNKIVLQNDNFTGDMSTLAQTFAASYSHNDSLQSIVLENNKLSGNITPFVQLFPNLKEFNAAGNNISDVFPAVPAALKLQLGNQTIESTVQIQWADVNFTQIASKLPTLLLYNHEAQNYTGDVSISLYPNDPAANPTDSMFNLVLSRTNGNLSVGLGNANNVFRNANGASAYLLCRQNTGAGSVCKVTFNFLPGDADFSSYVNVLDLQAIINFIFDEYKSKPFNYTAANLLVDGTLNVQDVVSMVNLLIATPTTVTPAAKKRSVAVDVQEVTTNSARLYVSDGKLMMYSPEAVSAADMVLRGLSADKISWHVSNYGLEQTSKDVSNDVHAVIYSLIGGTIPAGETVLADLSASSAMPVSAMLADKEAREIPVSVGNATDISALYGTTGYDVNIKGDIIMLSSSKQIANAQVLIYAADGRIVAAKTLSAEAGAVVSTHITQALVPGCYLIKLQHEGSVLMEKKFIVSKQNNK
jgi:hypothetical protein